MSAIFMASSSTLMTQYYDRERNYRYAAEQALPDRGQRAGEGHGDPSGGHGHVTLLSNASLTDATRHDSQHYVNLYVGMTGNTTGQFGQFASLVAEVNEPTTTRSMCAGSSSWRRTSPATRCITNQFSTGLCYGSGEFIRGLGFSNQGGIRAATRPTTTRFPLYSP